VSKFDRVCYPLAGICLLLGTLLMSVFTALRFSGFLLCAAAAALVAFALLSRWKDKYRWALWLRRAFLILFVAGLAFFAVLEAWVVSWARTDYHTPADAVIVLGAGVNGSVPSLSLETRLEAALAYVQDKPDIPIVVSGAQGRGEDISEAVCMADWLINHGVDSDRILLEEQATNTKENIRFSSKILADFLADPSAHVAVVSSDYHLCRAALYFPGNMIPVAAHLPPRFWPLSLNYFVREAFGVAAAIVFSV